MQRRTLTLATAGLLLVGLPGLGPTAATATTASHRTILSRVGLPAGIAAGSVACPNGHGQTGATGVHIDGPSTPPLGTGSLRVSAPASSLPYFTEKLSQAQLADLTTMKISTNSIRSSQLVDFVQFANDGTTPVGSGGTDLLYVEAMSPKWLTRNLLTATLLWHRAGVADPIGVGTLASYEAAHPTAQVENWGAADITCESHSSRFAVDDVRLGISGNVTTVNFEAPTPTKLSIDVLPHSVAAGTRIQLSTTLRAAGAPLPKAKLTLWKRVVSARHFRKIGSATTDAKGQAVSNRLRPSTTTIYQWRYAGTSTFSPVDSARLRLPVASAVTLHLASSSVAAGTPITATGKVHPIRVGAAVTLWTRRHGDRATPLATGRIHRHGVFSITAPLTSGSYEVFATVANDGLNIAGHSAVRTVFVG